jgi:hypothetical protein
MCYFLCSHDPQASDNDGIFWMPWADFTANFQNFYICRVFRTVSSLCGLVYVYSLTCFNNLWQKAEAKADSSRGQDAGPTWYRYTAEGEWSVNQNTAGGCSNYQATCHTNPQWLLKPSTKGTVFIALQQVTEPIDVFIQ